jgi:hypothetical protein
MIAKRQLHQQELIAMKHNRVLVWIHQEDNKVQELFLFLEQISEWLGVHKVTFH